jgi:hypothetical protein
MEPSWSYPIPMAMQPTAGTLKAVAEGVPDSKLGRVDTAGARPANGEADRAGQFRVREAPATTPKSPT